jgi:hypothetical protein
VWTLLTLPALAATPYRLTVDRGPDASDCPDATQLRQLVDAQAARATRGEEGDQHFRVEFLRDSKYFAVVQVRGRSFGQRVLRDQAEQCADLAEAVATSIALILEREAASSGAAEPAPDGVEPVDGRAPPVPVTSRSVQPAVRGANMPRRGYAPPSAWVPDWELGVGPAIAWEVTPNTSVGAYGQVGFWASDAMRFGLAALWFPRESLRYEEGEIQLTATVVTASACWQLAESPVRWIGCAEPSVMRHTAEGKGYREDFVSESTLWMLGGSLEAAVPITAPLSWVTRAGLMARTADQDIRVQEQGSAHSFSPVTAVGATMLSLEL